MRRKNISLAAISAILLVGLTVCLAPSILPSIPQVKASSRTVSLVGTTGAYYYWNNTNPTITVTQGDSLTIAVSSSNSIQHKLLIDLDKDGYSDVSDCGTLDECSGVVPPATSVGPFTVNSSPGTYTYYCTFHPGSMYGSFVVQSPATPDFTVSSSPTSVTANQGSSATSTITLSSVGGFSGSVSLAASASPSGLPQPTFSPTSISLSAGGSGSSTLTISTASSGGYYSTPVAPGSYAVNVTASSGSLAHSTTVTLTVSTTGSSPTGNSSLPVLPIVGGVVGAIIVVGVAILLIRRKR